MRVINYHCPPKLRTRKTTTVMPNLFNSVANELIKDFDSLFTNQAFVNKSAAVNVIENEDNFQIEVAFPGLSKEHFSVNVENDQLVISAENKIENTNENEEGTETETPTRKYTSREFAYTSFKRSFHLSDKVDIENISANYHQGILTVSLPKKVVKDTDKQRNIAIS